MEEEHYYEEPSWKKHVPTILSIVLIVLIVTYIVSSGISYRIVSLVNSYPLDNGEFRVANETIRFDESIVAQLQSDYVDDYGDEEVWCLTGEGNLINSVFYPVIKDKDVVHVTYEGCPGETLVVAHSHPFYDCRPSEQDWASFKASKSPFMGIMCGKNRIALFGR